VKTFAAQPKANTKFDPLPSRAPASEAELSLAHVRVALTRIDLVVRAAVLRWQQAGRDPNDAFRGLVVSDGDAVAIAALPLTSGWGDLAAEDDDLARQMAEAQAAVAQEAQGLLMEARRRGFTLRLQHLIDTYGLDSFAVDAFLLCLAPAVKIFSLLFLYKLAGALLEPITDKRITDCLGGIGNVLSILLITVLGIALMFFLTVTLMIGTGNTTVMLR